MKNASRLFTVTVVCITQTPMGVSVEHTSSVLAFDSTHTNEQIKAFTDKEIKLLKGRMNATGTFSVNIHEVEPQTVKAVIRILTR